MFPLQMVRLKIVEISSGPLCPCLPRKWYALKLSNPQVVHFVHVSLANGTPLKLSNPQVVHFLHVSNRKWYSLKLLNPQVVHFVHVSLANGTPWNYWTLKWSTLCIFPSQMVRLKIDEPSSDTLCPCFPRKWYALKLSNPQVVHFVHVSLANVTP